MLNSHEDHGKERRRHVRVNIRATARYFCPIRHQEVPLEGRLVDISEGGLSFMTFKDIIPLETEVHISFRLSDRETDPPLSVKGRVRHSSVAEENRYRFGIELLELRETERLALRSFIASQQMREYL